MEPEGRALDAGGVGGLVKVPRQLEVARDVVAEGEDHGERDQAALQLVELPVANAKPSKSGFNTGLGRWLRPVG